MRGRSKPLARTGGVSFLPSARVAPAYPRTSAQNPESHLRGYMRSGASRAGSTSFNNVAPPGTATLVRSVYRLDGEALPDQRFPMAADGEAYGAADLPAQGGRALPVRPLTAKSASASRGRGAPSWPGSLGG